MAKKSTPKKTKAAKAPKITDSASAKAYAKYAGIVLQVPYYVAEDGNAFQKETTCRTHSNNVGIKYFVVK